MSRYVSSEDLLNWLDKMKQYVKELKNESGKDDIGDVLYDGNHDGYLREIKEYLDAMYAELEIKNE